MAHVSYEDERRRNKKLPRRREERKRINEMMRINLCVCVDCEKPKYGNFYYYAWKFRWCIVEKEEGKKRQRRYIFNIHKSTFIPRRQTSFFMAYPCAFVQKWSNKNNLNLHNLINFYFKFFLVYLKPWEFC